MIRTIRAPCPTQYMNYMIKGEVLKYAALGRTSKKIYAVSGDMGYILSIIKMGYQKYGDNLDLLYIETGQVAKDI